MTQHYHENSKKHWYIQQLIKSLVKVNRPPKKGLSPVPVAASFSAKFCQSHRLHIYHKKPWVGSVRGFGFWVGGWLVTGLGSDLG